jgi:membrane protein implicated in regulation of membrane protease activity
MNWPEIYLVCFGVGSVWSVTSLLLGGLHAGHIGHGHFGHGHVGHGHGHGHAAHSGHSWLGNMINPSCAAVFLAWFGGVGYLLTRHSGLSFWINLFIALALGLGGAWILAAFLRFLNSREKPLDPVDYEMVGVLGRVSSTIRPDGVGEVIYVRDGARKPVCARSDEGKQIGRGEEVIVTRYEKGIAYVRTWEAMTQPGSGGLRPETLSKEIENVE